MSRSRIRLALYTDAVALGGAERSIGNLLAVLGQQVEPTVVGVDRYVVDWIAAFRPGTARVVLSPVRDKRDLRGMIAHVSAVRRLRPEIFHANLRTSWSCQYGIAAALMTPGTRTLTVEQAPIAPSTERQRQFKRVLSRRVDVLVAAGEALARYIESLIELEPGSVRTIYNSVPDAFVEPRPRLSPGPTVGAVGRFSSEKGLDVLVRAAARLPGVQLVLVGDGPQRPELERLVDDLGVRDRVLLTGWVDEPRAYLAGLDLLVLPSRLEGFPLAIVEAMLARLPVVASRVGSVPEAVLDGETGVLVPSGDEAALAAAVAMLLADPGLRARLGGRGRELALRRFTPRVAAAAFEALYEDLLR